MYIDRFDCVLSIDHHPFIGRLVFSGKDGWSSLVQNLYSAKRVGADVSLLITIGQLREHLAIQICMHTCTKNPSRTPGFFSNHRIHAKTCPPASLIS
jgi:hypothetical protein